MERPIYCVARVIEIREGYATQADKPKPLVVKFSMEPNAYTPSFTMEIMLERKLAESLNVSIGQRIRVDMSPASEADWDDFNQKTKSVQAVEG